MFPVVLLSSGFPHSCPSTVAPTQKQPAMILLVTYVVGHFSFPKYVHVTRQASLSSRAVSVSKVVRY
jgi:hypothetical protein